jgi:methyltransferase (TIGR00027 family)
MRPEQAIRTAANRTAASRTAEFMALFRALESARRPPGTRLFNDPIALQFLRPSLRAVVQLSRLPLVGAAVPWFIDRRWPGARTSAVARTRLIDDTLERALRAGVGQVVILGAGFDCRAYRMSALQRTRVFEVDHPATRAAKMQQVKRVVGELPGHVVFVDVDFNRQALGERLLTAGFDPAVRCFVIWEGVTNYLTAAAVDSTLRSLSANAAAGSQILFTYVHRGVLDGSVPFTGTENLVATLARAGEPWTFGIDPGDLRAYLADRGLTLIEDLGASDYRARYMGSAAERMTGYEFYRAALCDVRRA